MTDLDASRQDVLLLQCGVAEAVSVRLLLHLASFDVADHAPVDVAVLVRWHHEVGIAIHVC